MVDDQEWLSGKECDKTPINTGDWTWLGVKLGSGFTLVGSIFRLTVSDEIRNFCVTSQLEDSKQIEEILTEAS